MIYKNFIGGVWVESATGRTFKSYNPAHTGQDVGEFQDSSHVDIDRAVEFANDFSDMLWEMWRKYNKN